MWFYLGGPGNIAHAVPPYVPGLVIQIGLPLLLAFGDLREFRIAPQVGELP
jgi:hypothetical protein